MDYLIKGEMPAEPVLKTEQTNIEKADEKSAGESKVRIIKTIMFAFCGLLSTVLCIGVFWFAGTIIANRATGDKPQELVLVDRIVKQYTKAEILGMTKDGDSLKEAAWLDIPGVSEGDYICSDQDVEQRGLMRK